MTECYIVWNQDKTEGIITKSPCIAYEARKGAETNCFDENGNRSDLAIAFCNLDLDENATIQTININT